MNLFNDYFSALSAGALPGTAFAVPTYPTNMATTAAKDNILTYWRTLNQAYLDANNFINDLTAKLSAIETAVSGGGLAAYAALRLANAGAVAVPAYADTVLQFSALAYIGTSGPLLLTAATAQFLTPIQTALQNFETTYQVQLHAAGVI